MSQSLTAFYSGISEGDTAKTFWRRVLARRYLAASVALHLALIFGAYLLPGAVPEPEELIIPITLVPGGDEGAPPSQRDATATSQQDQPAAPSVETIPLPTKAPVARPRPATPRIAAPVSPPPPPIVQPQALQPVPQTQSPPATQSQDVSPSLADAASSSGASGGSIAAGRGAAATGFGAGGFGSLEGAGDEYFDRLRRHLARFKQYPKEAARLNQEGVVMVEFVIARDGTIEAARIDRTSGFPMIDQAVLDMLRNASPVPPLPPNFKGERGRLVLPVDFSLGPLSRLFR